MKKAQDRYQNLSEEEKEKKCLSIIVIEIRIFLKKKKENKVEYMRNYYLAYKKKFKLLLGFYKVVGSGDV